MYYFIVNKTGGSGKAAQIWDEAVSILDEKGIAYQAFVTERAHHATELASKICGMDDEDIRLVVVGGDGTINEVLIGITDFSRIRFGVMPVGSANDFATGMGLSADPISVLSDLLEERPVRCMDIGRAILPGDNSRIFGISSGIGMDAIVCKRALTSKLKVFLNRVGLGSLTYVMLTLVTLFDMKLVPTHLKLTDGDDTTEWDIDTLIFAAAMNMPIEGGGVAMAPDAGFDDRKLTMCAAFGVHGITAVGALLKVLKKKHIEDKKHFIVRDFDRLTITSSEPMVVHTDGEYAGDVTELTIEVLPGILKLI